MLKFISIIVFSIVSLNALTQKDLAIAIDHAVRQSVRTQKMAKEALLINMQIEPKKNAENMKFTTSMLNKDLNAFLGKSKSDIPAITDSEIVPKIKDFEKLWREVEKRATSIYNLNYTNEDIKYIAEHNIELLLKSRAVVLAIVKKHKENSHLRLANDIKIAGKQRMLVQMVSKDILMYLNNLNKKESLKDLKKVQAIDYNFNALFNGDKKLKCVGVDLPKIVNKLKEAQSKWNQTKPLITQAIKNKDKKIIKKLISNLDEVRVNMREAVILYTKSLNREKQILAINKIINNFYNASSKIKQLINLAGKQRMLTQQMAKLSIECSYNLEQNSCNNLEKDRKQFNKVLNLFQSAGKEGTFEAKLFNSLKTQLKTINNKWQPFNSAIIALIKSNGKDKNALKEILQNNIKLLDLSNKLVAKMLKHYKTKLTEIEENRLKIINIAGKNRMLSQKITKEYLEKNVVKLNSSDNLEKSIKLFNQIINILKNGDIKLEIPKATNNQIKQKLQTVEKIWNKLKPIYRKQNPSQEELNFIIKTDKILLKETNNIVKLITQTTDY